MRFDCLWHTVCGAVALGVLLPPWPHSPTHLATPQHNMQQASTCVLKVLFVGGGVAAPFFTPAYTTGIQGRDWLLK